MRILKIVKGLCLLVMLSLVTVGVLLGGFTLLEKLILPRYYYFYQVHPLAEAAIPYLTVIPVVTFLGVISGRLLRKREEILEDRYDLFFVWRRAGRGRPVLIALWLLCLYCSASSAAVVTEDKIICHSPLHPLGAVYDYGDVTQICTGFGQKRFALLEYQKKGNFYYQISLDGKKIVFSTPDVNESIARYADETYLELEDFDRRLTALGIPKQADEKGFEDCGLDVEYVERFLRIIAYCRERGK